MNNEPNQQAKGNQLRRALVTGAIILVFSAIAILYGQRFSDVVQARLFTPSSAVAGVKDKLSMTNLGNNLFYASSPTIENASTFNASCSSEERTTAILGCYWKRKIHLFDIKNKELEGTLEVTAAHEMLHAAYERLNVFERAHVDRLLRAEYVALKDDASLKQVMQYYAQAEPGAEINELHSIIGTTIAKLSPALEKYYANYFTDRAAIVAMNGKYNAVFSELSKRANDLQKQIDTDGPALKQALIDYNASRAQVESDISSFNARAQSGGFPSQSTFNVARSALMARVSQLNTERESLNAQVAAFNQKVDELNKLAVHVNELNQSINGVSAPTGL